MFGGRRRDRGRRPYRRPPIPPAVPLPRNLAFCRATPVGIAIVPELTQNPSIQLNERV
jgi:hypothetical protein